MAATPVLQSTDKWFGFIQQWRTKGAFTKLSWLKRRAQTALDNGDERAYAFTCAEIELLERRLDLKDKYLR